MASIGEYNGETNTRQGQRFANISRKKAEELGIYAAGNASYDRDMAAASALSGNQHRKAVNKITAASRRSAVNKTAIDADPTGLKAFQREMAKTAVQKQDAKAAQQHNENYSNMSAQQAYDDIITGGLLNANVDKIKATSAIKRMAE
jgi:hypothetical protein